MPNQKARDLRKNSTEAEKTLWHALRGRQFAGYKFRRQHPVGPFVADFACVEHHIIIEADGGQHADNDQDIARTAWLKKHGWQVIRFWNNDILSNTQGVLTMILESLQHE